MSLSLLSIYRQIIIEMNPGQPVVNPNVVGWSHYRWLVEAANCNIEVVCTWSVHERQRRAAMRAKRTQPPRPSQFSRPSGREPKVAAAE
ncbi:MAG: hypothetical protein WAM53_01595 [Terrimicrobiaceae bacterium]